ncbi:hypothetical protein CEP54_006646 [Fusarium duplospermum]|uniref:Uncharacterized protein n=1 Tax=Fusarium duplospermum TaxID=1325734 RepID=A0A428Q5W1_9HYPO|nr:hypothetical protein CEP54_006646 [Fusarium duplospermum]
MSSGEASPANPTPPVNPTPSRPRGIPPHREWKSFESHNWGVFNVSWVGENPTIEERRAYMGAYLDWMVGGSAEFERQARKKAEEAATIKFAQEGKTEVKVTIFEWAVDRIYWDIWFEAYSSVTGQPPFPWGRPEEDTNEPCSDTFARILVQRRNREQERQRQKQKRQRQQPQGVKRMRAGSFGGEQPQGSKRERPDSAEEPQSSQRRRLEAPAGEDDAFLSAMHQILSYSFGLRCVNDEDWNMNLLRYLIPRFADPQSRQRLYSLLEEGPRMTWYCLRSVCQVGYHNSIPNPGHLCGCTDHGHPMHFVGVWDANDERELLFTFS